MIRLLSRAAVLALIFTLALSVSCRADVTLPAIFSDNMVLQRGIADPVWGSADPGEKITVSIKGVTVSTVADAAGKWTVKLKPLAAGGPYALTVAGKNSLTVNNVLVGEVWLCSGQSNMQYSIGWHRNLIESDIAASTDPLLRCFIVPDNASFDPQSDVKSNWTLTDPTSILQYSAVAYYFARELRKALGVPVGIIESAYGGTQAESWVSLQGLDKDPTFEQVASEQISTMRARDADYAAFVAATPKWQTDHGAVDSGNSGLTNGWNKPDFDTTSWSITETEQPLSKLGLKGGGVVWYRKTVVIPVGSDVKAFQLYLGYGSCVYTVYFNGIEVPDTSGVPPFYPHTPSIVVPANLIKAGEPNVIAIRQVALADNWGLFVRTSQMQLPVDSSTVVDDTWMYKVEQAFPALTGQDLSDLPVAPTATMQNTATTLYNAMIAPLIPYAIKGAIWYQGESNIQHGSEYATLLPLLIEDWRARWNEGNFPFDIVQLANFGDPSVQPQSSSGWASVREGQLLTSENVANAGLAVTIDLGEAHNIHPVRKQEVGHRLASIALDKSYGLSQICSGPTYSGMTHEGNQIRLRFTDVDGGLVAQGGAPLRQFAIAGADKTFVWADARIDGDTVVVSSAQVQNPVSVRYAWADNPEGCNLYNSNGFPASPFRTDSW